MGQTVSRPRRRPCFARGILCNWALATLLGLGAAASYAQAPRGLETGIPPQPLAEALTEFARQSDLQLVYVSDLVTARMSKGSPAGLSPADTLTNLLAGTGLAYQFVNARTVQIIAATAAQARAPPPPPAANPKRNKNHPTPWSDPTDNITITGSVPEASLFPAADVQNEAASVTALDGDALDTRKLEQLTDYMSDIPGLSLDTSGSPSDLVPILRGVAPLQGDSTVAYYLDDAPLGATGSIGGAYRFRARSNAL